MALTNNFIPNTSLVFTPMDFSKQLAQRQADERNAVQGAAKFLGNVIDWSKNSQIADEMNKENPDYKKIDSLAATRLMNPDTSFSNWRWKKQMDVNEAATKKAESTEAQNKANNLANVKYEIMNTLSSIRPSTGMDSATKQSHLNKLYDLRTLAQKNGLSTDEIDSKIALVENDGVEPNVPTPGQTPVPPAGTPEPNPTPAEPDPYGKDFAGTNAEQVIAEVKQLLGKGGKATQNEFMSLKKKYGTGLAKLIGNDLYNELNAAHAKRIDADNAAKKAKERAAGIVKKGMNITSEDIEFMKNYIKNNPKSGYKLRTNSYGDEWFE